MWTKKIMEKGWLGVLFFFLSFLLAQPVSAAISSAYIDTVSGSSATNVNVTITPNNDGTTDRAYIRFASDVSGSFRVIVDTNGTSGFQVPDWSDPNSWQTSDTAMDGGISAGISMEFMFEGRDNMWRVLPNGTYDIEIIVDADGDWNTTADQVVDNSLTVTLQTASISGTVTAGGSPLSGAHVNAGSQYGWGDTLTASDGTYTVSGLQAGTYHVDAQMSGYVSANYSTDVTVTAGQNVAGIDMSMSPSVQIAGTISIPAAFTSFTNMWGGNEDQLWININGWTDDGSDWVWGNAHIHASDSQLCQNPQPGDDFDNDGVADLTECSSLTSTSYALDVKPPTSGTKTYHIRAEANGYASVEYAVTVDVSGGTQTIAMTKASRVYGTVSLPSATSPSDPPKWIDVNAKTADGTMQWGGGSITPGSSTGTFEIHSALAGTYTVEVRVAGYKTTTVSNVVVTAGQDTDLGTLSASQGATLSGTITITGDTTSYMTWQGDDGSQPLSLWVDAWSPDSNGWGGTQVTVTRGSNQSASYTIGGLGAGTYEVHCWLGEGYEQSPMPLTATLTSDSSAATGVNMTFAPYSGKITGTISGTGVTMANVVIKATKSGWDWQAPVMTQPASDGSYTLAGLGTSEYILEVNEYSNAAAMLTGAPPQPSGNFGTEMLRSAVMNQSTTSGQDFALNTGASISGTVSLESGYAGSVVFATDLVGQMVIAIPMKMAMMGGNSMFRAPIQADGSYTISGLGAGAYVVSPPTQLTDPSAGFDPSAQMFQDVMAPDIAGDNQTVAVSGGEAKTGVDFALADGYSVRGNITLPAVPSGNEWDWVCDLELRHPHKEGMGRHMPVFVRDFRTDPNDPSSTMTKTYSFTMAHVMDGDYVVQSWTPNYVPAYKNITVSGGNVVGANLELSKGANITGTLVDASTGQAITPDDGVQVHCEAWPWVNGSWRQTFNDPWSESRFIAKDTSGTEVYDGTGTYTGEFRLANLPAGTYVVTIEASHGMKQNGAKNYVGIRKAGVVVPATVGASVDIGTLKLQEGVTISGTVTAAATGLPIGNIEVEAEPADEKDGSTWSVGTTDSNGNYTIYGVDPTVKYYYVIGGARPDFMRFMPVNWGEVEKNVEVTTTGLTGVDFDLPAANASLSGTIHKTGSSAWKVPFMDDDMPAPFILLQKQGEIYTDPMDGIETIGEPSDTDTTTFSLDGIVPGTYNVKIFCMGYTTKILRGVDIAEGANTLSSTVELVEGGTVSGSVIKDDGTYPTTGEISQAVAVSSNLDVLIFGTITSNAASREVSAYSVSGLEAGKSYYLVFVNDDQGGPSEIHVMPNAIQAGDTYNAVIADTAPIITARAKKNDDGTFSIGIFSTSYLNDAAASDILALSTGNGSYTASLGADKMEINVTYTPNAADTTFTLDVAAHYGADNSVVTASFSYDVNATAWNQGKINTLMGGMVGLGQGDSSKVFFEPGAITDSSGAGVSTITLQKDDSGLSSSGVHSNSVVAKSVLAESTPALPSAATSQSALYDIALPSGDAITTGSSITVSLQYSDSVTDTSNLHIYHYTGGQWTAEDTNRSVDTVNKTISADVTSLSPFVVVTASSSSSSSTPSTSTGTSSGGGGGCNVANGPVTLQSGLAETVLLFLPLLVLMLLRYRRREMHQN